MADKAQLPKAYLRLDPNVDQTHPDVDGLIRLLCAANRQPQRGRFKSRELLDAILGKPTVKQLIERGDLVQEPDGRWYMDGWDLWQEGDLTVGERQRRIRAKRDRAVTPPLPDRDNDVTATVTSPLENRDRPSEARDVETLDVKTSLSKENPSRADVAALRERGVRVSPKQQRILDEIADRHDVTGYEWAASIVRGVPAGLDPLDAVMAADRKWQRDRRDEIDQAEAVWAAEKTAEPRRPVLEGLN